MEQGERRFPLLNSPTGLDTQVPVIVHTLLKKCPKISAIDFLFQSLNITTRQLGLFFCFRIPTMHIDINVQNIYFFNSAQYTMHKRSRCSGFLRVFLVPIEYVCKRNIAKVVFKLLTLISPGSHNQSKGVSHILPQLEICNLTSEEGQSVVLLLHFLKETVSRDFLLLVFFMNQFPPSP